jgi:hypothetical protein
MARDRLNVPCYQVESLSSFCRERGKHHDVGALNGQRRTTMARVTQRASAAGLSFGGSPRPRRYGDSYFEDM